ncbi:hypothetical protein F975_02619 [Acinetobacter sp. ANC 3789]|nr:hypothetical protein F975_02619 [Acinetobacter sp. ANC 3789]
MLILIPIFILLVIASLIFRGVSDFIQLNFFKRLIWSHLTTSPLWCIFFLHEIGQYSGQMEGTEWFSVVLFSLFILPFILAISLTIYLIISLILTALINHIFISYHQEWKLIYNLYIISILLHSIFELLWWICYYNSNLSIRNIIFSNIFLCISVWLPIFITVFLEHRDKRKTSS